MKGLLLFVAALVPIVLALPDAPASLYGQALVHTADGATYVVTGDLSDVHYDYTFGTPVLFETISNATGLPVVANPAPNYSLYQTNSPPFVQISLYTADNRFYTITGSTGADWYVYKPETNITVLCTLSDGSLGLPPATNDIIMKNGFEHIDFCWE